MTVDPIFVRTTADYASYGCFWRLVELSGFKTVPCHLADPESRALYVISPFTAEHLGVFGPRRISRKCILAWLNLERPDSGHWPPEGLNASNDEGAGMGCADVMWTYDRTLARARPWAIFTAFGSDQRLHDGIQARKEYDFAHISYSVGRREEVYAELRKRGLREAPNEPGPHRPYVLARTRLILQVHQTPLMVGSPQRAAVAAAHGLPFITETISDPWPLVAGEDHLQSPREALPGLVEQTLLDSRKMAALGDRLRSRLCEEHSFGQCMRQASADTLARMGLP